MKQSTFTSIEGYPILDEKLDLVDLFPDVSKERRAKPDRGIISSLKDTPFPDISKERRVRHMMRQQRYHWGIFNKEELLDPEKIFLNFYDSIIKKRHLKILSLMIASAGLIFLFFTFFEIVI